MRKPTIPIEVADAIEYLRNGGVFETPYTNKEIISGVFNLTSSSFVTLSAIPFDTLMAALVNGYERELTEEQQYQKIREMYRQYGECLDERDLGARKAIRDVLTILGTQIEGVNA